MCFFELDHWSIWNGEVSAVAAGASALCLKTRVTVPRVPRLLNERET